MGEGPTAAEAEADARPEAAPRAAVAHGAVVVGRIAAAVIAVALVALLLWQGRAHALGVKDIITWIDGAGLVGPVAFVALYVVAGLLLLPGTALAVAGALLFPLPWSLVVVWVGAVVAGFAPFWIARRAGRGAVERLIGHRIGRLDAHIARNGFQVVLVLRLAGLPPYNTMNYLAGLTPVRFVHYAVGSALGLIPMMVAVVLLVDRIGRAPRLVDLATDPVLYALVALVIAVVWVAHALRRRASRLVERPDDP